MGLTWVLSATDGPHVSPMNLAIREALETKFHIIVLIEIGSRNVSMVEHILENHQLHYVTLKENMFGGVGIYVNEELINVHVVNEFNIRKWYHFPKCEIESLFIKFKYHNRQCIVGRTYRHPNGKTAHAVNDLETSLNRIGDAITTILVGDINNDLSKFENEDTMNYITTLLSNRNSPHITLPSRLTNFSATIYLSYLRDNVYQMHLMSFKECFIATFLSLAVFPINNV